MSRREEKGRRRGQATTGHLAEEAASEGETAHWSDTQAPQIDTLRQLGCHTSRAFVTRPSSCTVSSRATSRA